MQRLAIILASLFSFLLTLSAASAADPTPIALGYVGLVDIAPTATGYAAVYVDFANGDILFRRLDATGRPGPEVVLGPLFEYPYPFELAIVPAGKGFVVYASGRARTIRALPIDANGQPRGTVKELARYDTDWDVVDAGGSHLLVYNTFRTGFHVFSQVVRLDGSPAGDPNPLAVSPDIGFITSGFMDDVGVALTDRGFLAAWSVYTLRTVNSRPLRSNGRGDGPGPETVAAGDCSRGAVTYGGTGDGAVIYATCASPQLALRLHGPSEYADPIPLDIDGRTVFTGFFEIDLAADGPRDEVGVLVATMPPESDPDDPIWVFGRYDAGGKRLSPLLDLSAAYGVFGSGVHVRWDARRSTYVLSWTGTGPQGDGVYTLRVPR